MDPGNQQSEASWRPAAPAFDPESPGKVAVVHFWAEWNGYDLKMDKLLQGLTDVFDEKFPLRSCDVDREANWATAKDARVLSVPALSLVVDGVPRETLIGLRPSEELRTIIERWRSQAFTI